MYIQNDKILYKSTNKSIRLEYSDDGYIEIKDYSKSYSERYSYYDISTGEVVKKKKETDNSVSNISLWEQLTNYKEFSCTGGSYGLMNGDKILLPCEWDDFHYLDNGIYTYLSSKGKKYIIGEKNKKSYLINLKIKK